MTDEALVPLKNAAAAFVDLVHELPDEALRPQDWGPREVLAHLLFAFENYAGYLQAAADGRKPAWFKGTVVEHNACAVAENAQVPVPVLIQRLEAAVQEFCELASRPELQTMQFRTRARSAARPLRGVIPTMPSHLLGHTRDLRRQFG